MRLFQAPLDTPLDSPFSATLSVHGLHFTVCALSSHVLSFTVFRTHPGPEVGAIPARPGPILLPGVPYRIGPGRAETDFLATSDKTKVVTVATPGVFLRMTKSSTRTTSLLNRDNVLEQNYPKRLLRQNNALRIFRGYFLPYE